MFESIAEVDQAYWILLKDVPKPNQERETVTVRIPKSKTLSTIAWSEIQDYVRHVTDEKLAWKRAAALNGNRSLKT
jgi:hypothetical protein